MVSLRTCFWLFLSALLLMLPAFLFEGGAGRDLHCQSLWVTYFSKALWNGVLYPRWLPELNAGNGSPVFFYYPPFAYYISAVFYALNDVDEFAGYIPMAASTLLAAFFSGITFFLWIRKDVAQTPALLASMLYVVLPFHIGHTFYYTLLYSTVWAYVWLPLLLIAARRIACAERWGVLLGAVSVALMICTNMPSALITLPLVCAYGLCVARNSTLVQLLRNALLTGLLGLGLSAFFLLPSLAYTSYGLVDLHWQDPHHETEHFFTTLFSHDPNQMVMGDIWLFHGALLLLLYGLSRFHPAHYARRFALISSIIALLMMLSFGYKLWQVVPVLFALQHPWRLFIVVNLAVSMLAAFSLPRHKILVVLLIMASIGGDWYVAITSHVTLESFKADSPIAYERYDLQVEQYPEYLSLFSLLERYFSANGLHDVKNHMAQIELKHGDAQTQVLLWESRLIRLSYTATHESQIGVRQMYFPGWQAFSNGTALHTSWDNRTGRTLIVLPPGEGIVDLKLLALWPEILGKLISLLSLAVLMISGLLTLRRPDTNAH